jgi:hypothetical protein
LEGADGTALAFGDHEVLVGVGVDAFESLAVDGRFVRALALCAERVVGEHGDESRYVVGGRAAHRDRRRCRRRGRRRLRRR